MKRKLPPLQAVRAFEAAARNLSFKRAAEELNVTPAAVSHQIRLLEEWCGIRLFERHTRRVVLTMDAALVLPALTSGFDAFNDAFSSLVADRKRLVVTLSATVAFTARWLVPRISAFHEQNPELDLRLHASDDVVDLRTEEFDLAVRYGDGDYKGMKSEKLFDDYFAPMCSPILGITDPSDLESRLLLHTEWRNPTDATPTWHAWRRKAGIETLNTDAGVCFTDESHVIQAAISGQGVALLSTELMSDETARGILIQPFGPVLKGHQYSIVYPEGSISKPVEAVHRWLKATQRSPT